MSETTHLQLPRLEPAQAQKHVTVNEALQALDLLVHAAVLSRSETQPPASPAEGDRHIVASPAAGAWAGREGELAAWQDGAWRFLSPRDGWRVFVADEGRIVRRSLGAWREPLVTDGFGAGPVIDVVSEEHLLAAGAVSDTGILIPARSILLGVTGLVSQEITGATAFDVGVADDPQRFGTGIGAMVNAQLNGPANPSVYWSDTALRLSAQGGAFTGGAVRLAAHVLRLRIPDFL